MIQELWIKNIATYDSTGVHIANLKKINFIYGSNGCGKTTITKFADAPTDPLYNQCATKWKNDFPLKVLAYNRDFRERNFGKGSLPGVFTLGHATRDQIDAIVKMQDELERIKNQNADRKETREKITQNQTELLDHFKDSIWAEIYKKHEVEFRDAFKGSMGSRHSFMVKLVDEFKNNEGPVLKYEDLKTKAAVVFGTPPVSMPLIPSVDFTRLIEIESDPIWKKKIFGKGDVAISGLIQQLNMNDWVNKGRGYLQDDARCPFCQQDTISESFKKQLEDFFDAGFVNDTGFVNRLSGEHNQKSENLTNILQQIERNEKANAGSKLNVDLFSSLLRTNTGQFFSNTKILDEKIKEPSRSVSLVDTKTQLESIHKLIDEANMAIRAHNKIVQNFASEKRALISHIWRYLAEVNKVLLRDHVKKLDDFQKAIDAMVAQHQIQNTKYKELKDQIEVANRGVTSVQPSVDKINRTLRSYGFHNFELVPSPQDKNQYCIHREDGSLAESTLSEGEVTFITFLYFLQLARGAVSQEAISEDRVLIVDDPVSSLDSSILSVVSSMMKQTIKDILKGKGPIKQLILLTHNVYFHKEVSFMDRKSGDSNDRGFWILRRNSKVSSIQSYEANNPIQGSYELLWQELKDRKNTPGIGTQNIMRRIIENYFRVLGKYGDDDLIEKFEDTEEREICRSLISWIHDGSHSIPEDLFVEHPDTTVAKYSEVFRKIFDQMGHLPHYNMMMGIVDGGEVVA